MAVLLLLAFALSSCTAEERGYPAAAGLSGEVGLFQAASAPRVQSEAARPQPEQLFIRTAELRILVPGVDDALARADTVVQRHRATITDSRRAMTGNDRLSARMIIRVPSASLTDLIRDLREIGSVRSEALRQEDVTRAYTDLETQLAVKRQTVTRLRQLLSSSTGRLADVLEVERELERVVIEVERLEGERRYYADRVSLSTVEVELFESGADATPPSPTIGDALRQGLEVLSVSAAWMVYIVTFVLPWAVLAIGGWLLARRIRERRRPPAA